MAVFQRQLLPSTTTPTSQGLSFLCIVCTCSKLTVAPALSTQVRCGLLFAEKEDLKMNKVLPTVFENFFLQKGKISSFGKHKPDVTSLHKQPEQIRPVA